MEGYSRNLNMIPSEEKKLELRLGPPTGDWSRENDETILPYVKSGNGNYKFSSFLQLQTKQRQSQLPVMMRVEESSGCTTKADMQSSAAEKKTFSPAVGTTKTAPVSNSAQKRTAPAPVVGWPPIRSFRKNIASSSSNSVKTATEPQNGVVPSNKSDNKKPMEICQKGLFVKINMDGIPIGRKVDLKAYDSYDKLSSAVDQLFRGLLAAQSDPSAEDKEEGGKAITGLLDGSGEYTLVYEDNEGDRMLVGDVPWHMFVSTVKRLRVLKSCDLSTLTRGTKQG